MGFLNKAIKMSILKGDFQMGFKLGFKWGI